MGNKISLEENLIELRIVSKQVRQARRGFCNGSHSPTSSSYGSSLYHTAHLLADPRLVTSHPSHVCICITIFR